MPSLGTFVTDILNEYRKVNIANLSKFLQNCIKFHSEFKELDIDFERFVQDKLQEVKEHKEYEKKETQNDKRKILGQALMFMVIGMGFLSMGVAFFQDSAYLYPSIFLLAIGVITTIFGLIGMIEQMIKNRVEKNLEIQKITLGG